MAKWIESKFAERLHLGMFTGSVVWQSNGYEGRFEGRRIVADCKDINAAKKAVEDSARKHLKAALAELGE